MLFRKSRPLCAAWQNWQNCIHTGTGCKKVHECIFHYPRNKRIHKINDNKRGVTRLLIFFLLLLLLLLRHGHRRRRRTLRQQLLSPVIWAKMRCATVKRLTSQAQHIRLRHGRENLLSLSGRKAGEWTKKAENRQEGVDKKKRNKADTKWGIETREFLAQNFQKVGMLFILTGSRHSHGEYFLFCFRLFSLHLHV